MFVFHGKINTKIPPCSIAYDNKAHRLFLSEKLPNAFLSCLCSLSAREHVP